MNPQAAANAASSVRPQPGRHEHGGEQRDAAPNEQRERGRDREPVDVRRHRELLLDDLARRRRGRSVLADRRGQAESASSRATSGTTTASSAGRRSRAAGDTEGPGSWCRIAEISRSWYMAASTIAPRRSRPMPSRHGTRRRGSGTRPRRPQTRARRADDPGRHHERREGRPAAGQAPEPRELAGQAAPLDRAASMKSEAETSPCATICTTAPSKPRSLKRTARV